MGPGSSAAAPRVARRRRLSPSRLTLRTRLLLSLVAVVGVGLTAMGALTYGVLAGYLRDRVDQQVVEAVQAASQDYNQGATTDGDGDNRPDGGARPPSFTPGAYVQLRGADGVVVAEGFARYRGGPSAGTSSPKLPTTLPAARPAGQVSARDAFTVRSADSERYRAVAASYPGGVTVVIALPLTDNEGTLGKLLGSELLVALAVIAALSAVSWLLVRRDLAPLERMTGTAGAIAAGDLSRRVEAADDHTEVGKLGTALNIMLGRIEESFAVQAESEATMRRFLADASHELRTPLTSIRGYAEMFRRGAADNPADLATAMRRIEGESTRMGGLVEDLLTLARLDEQRPMESEPVDLVTLAEDAAADARAVDPRRMVRLEAPEDAVVLGDSDRLRQAVANLVANALAYTPAGTPLDLAVVPDGQSWRLAVRDHGPGLTPEQQAKVFERFWRADPARTSGTAGSGLGLSIVASVLTAHGGRADVDAPEGGGTRFTLVLPVPEGLG